MRKILQGFLSLCLIAGASSADAQRYYEEVFSSSEIITETVVYATNIDFMTSNLAGANVPTDIGTLSFLVENDQAIPAEYFDPGDASTDLKVTDIPMDIYYPDPEIDDIDIRPVIVHVHTGNFLPPPLNGSPNGTKTDSIAVHMCKQWAKRGYVAVSIDYRLGWNPIAETVQERRGTLLNAVYRAIHDTKMAVRFLRADAMDVNTWGIDESKMVIYGQGSGGYVSTSYMTLDDAPTELFLEKFLPNPFDPTVSYVDTLIVGQVSGFGFSNSLNLYRDNGISADVNMTINAGGALADESWLGPDDVPMVAFNCVRDDFAPFDEGTVIVPTTLEEVVDVHGANFFIQKANDLGLNDVFADLPDGEYYTDAARVSYGQTFEVSNDNMITVNETPEGLFPIIRPLYGFLQNEASPWEWWDPNSAIAQVEVAPGVTAHMASLASNPDMSPEKGMAYADSIQGYMLPRVMCVLELPENACDAPPAPANNDCAGSADIDGLFHTGSSTTQVSDIYDNTDAFPVTSDPTEGYDDCFGEPAFNVEPVLNNTLWFSFVGDGEEYTIETGDCDGTTDYIDFGDTQFAIYTGECGALVPVAGGCNEDSPNAVTDDYFAGLDFMTEDGVTYYMMVDGFNGIGVAQVGVQADGEFCINVTQLSIGVDELDLAKVVLYPNPTSGVFTVTAENQIDRINVHNVLGELVETVQAVTSNNIVVDLSGSEKGVYFLSIETNGQIISKRVIVK